MEDRLADLTPMGRATLMWKLTIEDDEGTKTPLPLVREEYHLGRDEGNSVRLTDRNISRRHATLRKMNDATWQLVDHDSYNGCFVNGQRVAGAAVLAHADLIQVGDYRVFVTNEDLVTDDVALAADPSSRYGVPATELPDRLIVIAGPIPGLEYRLDRGPVTIGRADECSIAINHPSVSRVHVQIQPVANGRYEILDKESANGVRVNAMDLKRGLLEAGDLIELGDVRLRFLERGQPLRPSVDASQQLPAVFDRAAPSARPAHLGGRTSFGGDTQRGRGSSRMVMLATVVLVLVAGAYLFKRPTRPNVDAIAAVPSPPDGSPAFEAAKQAADAGDWRLVIQKLGEIPESSALRQSPDVAALYNRWADAIFQKSDQTNDAVQKRQMLTRVAQTTGVEAARRARASEALAKLDTTASADSSRPSSMPAPATTRPYRGQPLQTSAPDADPGPPDRNGMTKLPRDRAAPPPGDLEDFSDGGVAKQRRQLEGVVWSGKASQEQIKLLAAICSQQNDRPCRDRARSMLNH